MRCTTYLSPQVKSEVTHEPVYTSVVKSHARDLLDEITYDSSSSNNTSIDSDAAFDQLSQRQSQSEPITISVLNHDMHSFDTQDDLRPSSAAPDVPRIPSPVQLREPRSPSPQVDLLHDYQAPSAHVDLHDDHQAPSAHDPFDDLRPLSSLRRKSSSSSSSYSSSSSSSSSSDDEEQKERKRKQLVEVIAQTLD